MVSQSSPDAANNAPSWWLTRQFRTINQLYRTSLPIRHPQHTLWCQSKTHTTSNRKIPIIRQTYKMLSTINRKTPLTQQASPERYR
jgi:hypothetical protein